MPQVAPILLEAAVVTLGVVLVLLEAILNDRDKRMVAWMGIFGLGAVLALSFLPQQPSAQTAAYWNFYAADALAMFFKRFALLTTILVLVMSLEYRDVLRKYIFGGTNDAGLGEFYALPVFTCAGLMWMASAVDFVMIFVSLELVTISFYVLVSYMRRNNGSLEAGVKYLILGALSTGFLVYGITWVFGITGQTNLVQIAKVLPGLEANATPLLFGMSLIMIALGFKLAATPFQIWVPDVYQGAPTPITAYLSVGSKAAGVVVLMRVIETFAAADFLREKLVPLLVVLAVLTLLYGNLAALPQENFKRLLAYSSIAHAGYILTAIAAIGSAKSGQAVLVYLAGYLLMTLLSFLVVTVVFSATGSDEISAFNGLAKRSPFLSGALLIAMASLAGVPLTVGFVGKFFAFAAAFEEGLWVLLAVGVVAVAAGFYYYLKVVRAMYWREGSSTDPIEVSGVTRFSIGALAVAIVVLGFYPAPIFALMK